MADRAHGPIQFRRARQRHHPDRLYGRRHSKSHAPVHGASSRRTVVFGRPVRAAEGVYRGVTTTMQVSLGLAFTGQMMIELIEQHDEEASVFGETLKARG